MKLAINRLEVGNRTGSSPVEQVAAHATVARTPALASAGVGEGMLDGDPLAQFLTTGGRSHQFLETLLERLILGDGDGTPMPEGSVGTLRSTRAVVAQLGI